MVLITCLQGTIEEKIFQRQVSKQGLSGVVEQTGKTSHSSSGHVQFSLEELRVKIIITRLI